MFASTVCVTDQTPVLHAVVWLYQTGMYICMYDIVYTYTCNLPYNGPNLQLYGMYVHTICVHIYVLVVCDNDFTTVLIIMMFVSQYDSISR